MEVQLLVFSVWVGVGWLEERLLTCIYRVKLRGARRVCPGLPAPRFSSSFYALSIFTCLFFFVLDE
jgi:hypothetical protein